MFARFRYLIKRWLTRYGSQQPTGEHVLARHDLRHFARLRASGMSFGSAVSLGLGLGSVRSESDTRPRYKGAGLDGDRDAIAGDFRRAIRGTTGDDTAERG